jgi:hypothetical protein
MRWASLNVPQVSKLYWITLYVHICLLHRSFPTCGIRLHMVFDTHVACGVFYGIHK